MSQYETLELMKKGVYYTATDLIALSGCTRMVINKDLKKLHKWGIVKKKVVRTKVVNLGYPTHVFRRLK